MNSWDFHYRIFSTADQGNGYTSYRGGWKIGRGDGAGNGAGNPHFGRRGQGYGDGINSSHSKGDGRGDGSTSGFGKT